MKRNSILGILFCLFLINNLSSCKIPAVKNNDYWVSFNDTITDQYGYKNSHGDIVIPLGKYERCFTDTFKTYAIVVKTNDMRSIAIDRQENVMYEIYAFDNGPDYPSDGLFRILENNKIGFADSITGKVVIKPQFDCAWPFENGIAKVSNDCKTQMEGEHSFWVSDHWFYIDKSGKKVAAFLLKYPLLTWMRKSPVEIGCMLESEFSFKDPVFNCDYKNYINKGDPIKKTSEFYEGITFPVSLVPKIHPSIKILNLEFEHGNLREIFIEFKDSLLKSKIAEIFDLPTERTSFPDNIIDIGYGENISASSKPMDPKFTKWLIIYGFDHIGAGDL